MEPVNLKRGLFGYTASSVREYMESLNAELSERANTLFAENEELRDKCNRYESQLSAEVEKQDQLLEKMNALSKEIEVLTSEKTELSEQIEDLNIQLERATKDKLDYKQGQNELADVMLEAKRFANDLKQKTEMEFEQKKAANNNIINQEKRRIEKYISNINELNEILHKVCNDFEDEINNRKKELNHMLDDMDSFKKSTSLENFIVCPMKP